MHLVIARLMPIHHIKSWGLSPNLCDINLVLIWSACSLSNAITCDCIVIKICASPILPDGVMQSACCAERTMATKILIRNAAFIFKDSKTPGNVANESIEST